ncbi:hypothetical protein Tco_1575419 [Tanacetum coccineum]
MGSLNNDKELEMLFQPMFDEHLEQYRVDEPVPYATEINAQVVPPGTSLSTTIAQDAPSTSDSSSTSDIHLPVQHQEITEEPIQEDTSIIHNVLHPSHNLVTGDPGSAQSSSGNVKQRNPTKLTNFQILSEDGPKIHTLDNIVGNPLVQMDVKMLFEDGDLQEDALSVNPEDLKPGKFYSRLSSKESYYGLKPGS